MANPTQAHAHWNNLDVTSTVKWFNNDQISSFYQIKYPTLLTTLQLTIKTFWIHSSVFSDNQCDNHRFLIKLKLHSKMTDMGWAEFLKKKDIWVSCFSLPTASHVHTHTPQPLRGLPVPDWVNKRGPHENKKTVAKSLCYVYHSPEKGEHSLSPGSPELLNKVPQPYYMHTQSLWQYIAATARKTMMTSSKKVWWSKGQVRNYDPSHKES